MGGCGKFHWLLYQGGTHQPARSHLASLVVSVGRGCFLAKADVKETYRMVPVHPEDQHLLGAQWDGSVYIDKVLPFGLCSAPKIFSAVADAVQWTLFKN